MSQGSRCSLSITPVKCLLLWLQDSLLTEWITLPAPLLSGRELKFKDSFEIYRSRCIRCRRRLSVTVNIKIRSETRLPRRPQWIKFGMSVWHSVTHVLSFRSDKTGKDLPSWTDKPTEVERRLRSESHRRLCYAPVTTSDLRAVPLQRVRRGWRVLLFVCFENIISRVGLSSFMPFDPPNLSSLLKRVSSKSKTTPEGRSEYSPVVEE